MEAFKFTNVEPGDILVLDYDLNPGDNSIAKIEDAILSEGLTGTWLEPYKKFKVSTVNKSCSITLKAGVLDFSKLTVGSTFNFGKYQVENETPWAIEWEIVHQTDEYQIAQTKQIIDMRSFDAKEPNNTDSNDRRKTDGNNNWQYSNIKQFLNSDKENWYSAQHSYDAPPNSSNVWESTNPYDNHKGFLYYFTNEEKNLLKDMTLTLANPTVDGGGSYTWTGKVWLPTYTQLGFGNNETISEGFKYDKYSDDNSRIKTINKYCAENNDRCISQGYSEGTARWYWCSSANVSFSYSVRGANYDGTVGGNGAYIGINGLAPCICLPRTIGGGVINDIISFYIDDTLYKSPRGYTFAQWVNTSYNYNGWYKNSSKSDRIDNYNTNTYISGITGSTTIENGKKYTSTDIMINFTINGETLDAKPNSTWSDWVNGNRTITPSHNWSILDNTYIISSADNIHINDVTANDKIIENMDYSYSTGSSPSTDLSTLTVGSTFNFGKYQVETETPWAIEWEIVHQTDEYQIAQTKQIIDLRCFDGKEPNNTDSSRTFYGNNNWQYSNIKQFLNSDKENWYSAQHQYDAPPNSDNVDINPYDTHKGFLYYFTNEEKSLLKDMTLTLANPTVDGGGSYTWTGKVWLPTYTQLGYGDNESISEGTKFDKYIGNNSRIKTINKYCAENNSYCIDTNKTEGTEWYYRCSSARVSSSFNAWYVDSTGGSYGDISYRSHYGLAPCIKIPKTGALWS